MICTRVGSGTTSGGARTYLHGGRRVGADCVQRREGVRVFRIYSSIPMNQRTEMSVCLATHLDLAGPCGDLTPPSTLPKKG
jgi:hypothetical protein